MSVKYSSYKPSNFLKDIVDSFWITEATGDANELTTENTCFPMGMVDWIIQVSGENLITKLEKECVQFPKDYFVGIMSKPVSWQMRGSCRVIGIRFRPEGFLRLFNAPLSELADSSVPTCDIMKNSELNLREKLVNSNPDTAKQIVLIETHLNRLLVKSQYQNRHFISALYQIRNCSGAFKKTALVDNIFRSDRQIQRLFKDNLGVSPKQYENIVRFGRTISAVKHSDIESWASLAYHVGYADQAHLIRDFKKYTGITPGTISDKSKLFC